MQACHNYLISEKNNNSDTFKEGNTTIISDYVFICCPLHTGRPLYRSIINAKTSLQSGRDRDSQAKKGGIAGLTGKKGRESGIWEAYWGPSFIHLRERRIVRVKCFALEHNTKFWLGLERAPLDPKTSALTRELSRPPRLQKQYRNLKFEVRDSLTILFEILWSSIFFTPRTEKCMHYMIALYRIMNNYGYYG